MLEFSGLILGLALVMRFFPQIPFSRLLNERLIQKPRAWLVTGQATDFVYIIILAAMFLAAGEMVALFGQTEPFLAYANLALHFGAVMMAPVVAAVFCDKIALRTRSAKLSFWRAQALHVSSSTFGKCVRRRRGTFSSADNDDDPVFAIAA